MSHHERLTVLDEMWLHLEGPDTHMHVGAVVVFEGPPPDYEDFRDMVGRRLQLVPRFRQKIATVPFGLGRPVWVDDTHFNLEYHVRHTALPPPGDAAKLRRLAGRIMSQQLDRSKPLWEIWFVEGLADGRWALITKTHHAVVDGVSGADIMTVMLELGPEPQEIEYEPWKPSPEPTADQLLLDALSERITSPAEVLRTVQSAVLDPATLPNRVLEGVKALGSFVGGTITDPAPPSTLNQRIGPHRRFEMVLADLDEIKSIKNAHGTTVNDVVVSVVTGALRRMLAERGERVDRMELRAMIPVSVRSDAHKGALGNKIATMWATLPVRIADPVERLMEVNAHMGDLKNSGQAVGAQILTSLGEYAPPTILAQASRLVQRQRAYNLTITNVPGPQIPLYATGRQMVEVYPVLPLAGNTSLGVALISYNGTIGFGLLGDYDTVPDIGVLAEGIEKSIAELLETVS